MFKKILIPVDLNDLEPAKGALERGRSLATLTGASVALLYVMPIVPSVYLEYVPPDFETSEKARVAEELGKLAATFGLPSDRIATAVRSGGVYHEVLAEAEEAKADLIVVGSHWPTLATYLVGSHATNIVRHAECSVLVVRT